MTNLSGVRTGPLEAGERVTLIDGKGRRHSIVLTPGKVFHTTRGGINHDDLIGGPEGVVITSVGGFQYLVWRPLMHDYTVSMPRGAAVIYPKDQGQIITWADIYPGARVLEAGVGSGALSMALLRAIGPTGTLYSYERREEFAEVAQKNVEWFFQGRPENWNVRLGGLPEALGEEELDRAILDMLAPWECVEAIAAKLRAGGILCCYVATTTQLARTMDTIRAHGGFAEPSASELITREWHAEGLAVRPGHGTSSHTGFLIFARRLAPGVTTPMKRRRPAPGAYGPDYQGPRPFGMIDAELQVSE
ncbi:MAG: tRNA (adenine-N1)-methyltransferase [Propionibacteriaceae bacterium]